MSNKTLKALLGIFLLLAAVASYPLWNKQIVKLSGNKQDKNAELNFSVFTARSVDQVIIKKGSEEKKLSKNGDKWKVDSYDASQKEVDEFFDQLKKSQIESLVSKNKDNHKSFGVAQDSGTLLSFIQGPETSAFVIGQGGDGTGRFYARKENGDNVYLVSGSSLPTKLSQTILAWRDKVLADIPKQDFQKAEITINGSLTTISKTQEGKLEINTSGKEKQVLDESTSDGIFTSLNALTADDFLSEADIAEFQKIKNKTTVRLLREHGDSVEIQITKKDTNWWAQVTGKGVYYKLSESRISSIFKAIN